MTFLRIAAVFLLAFAPLASPASNITVAINDDAARAVLRAVQDEALTMAAALEVARLPGSQGLIRKARSYGRPGTSELFAKALVAAAHHDSSYQDPGKFNFEDVREHAAATSAVLTALESPALHRLATAEARIAQFTPPDLRGKVNGYLVVGGTAGGFAFGDPEFFLNLQMFPSAVLAATIMEHELFHAVQGLAMAAHKAPASATACIERLPGGTATANLLRSLEMEGTAALVGDELALPTTGADEPTAKERADFDKNVSLVKLHVTQLELAVHGLATGVALTPDDVYAANFYGYQEMYGLGYVMAQAIAKEGGAAALQQAITEPGALFVLRYTRLPGYGNTLPVLGRETVARAAAIAACAGSH